MSFSPDEQARLIAKQYGGVDATRAAELLRRQASLERGDATTAIPRRFTVAPFPPDPVSPVKPGGKKPRQKAIRVTTDVSASVQIFYTLLKHAGIVLPVPEFRFDLTRKWCVDYSWPAHKLALEVEGGLWTQGRHTRGKGALSDMEKYNRLTIMGWRLLRCTPSTLADPATVALIREALTPQQDSQ